MMNKTKKKEGIGIFAIILIIIVAIMSLYYFFKHQSPAINPGIAYEASIPLPAVADSHSG